MRTLLYGASALAFLAIASPPATGAYPEKPIQIIVPFGPGGGGDTNAQLFKRALEENKLLPQPTVIIHVPGAGGNIGAKRALGAKADGYTILQTIVNLASNQALGNIDFGPGTSIRSPWRVTAASSRQ